MRGRARQRLQRHRTAARHRLSRRRGLGWHAVAASEAVVVPYAVAPCSRGSRCRRLAAFATPVGTVASPLSPSVDVGATDCRRMETSATSRGPTASPTPPSVCGGDAYAIGWQHSRRGQAQFCRNCHHPSATGALMSSDGSIGDVYGRQSVADASIRWCNSRRARLLSRQPLPPRRPLPARISSRFRTAHRGASERLRPRVPCVTCDFRIRNVSGTA